MPMRSLRTPCSFSTSTTLCAIRPAMYGTAPSAHCQVIAGRMRPSIQGRSISGAVQVRTCRFEENGLAAVRQHGVADVDVVFPIALIGTGHVANVGARE